MIKRLPNRNAKSLIDSDSENFDFMRQASQIIDMPEYVYDEEEQRKVEEQMGEGLTFIR